MSSPSLPLAPPASHTTQYVTAAAATIGAFCMGTILGYSSPSSPQLQAANGTNCSLPGVDPFTDLQTSWYSSSVNLGALAGVPTTGLLLNRMGRKPTMVWSALPFLVGWGLIGLGQGFWMLLFGRVFCGVCAGLASLAIPTYVGEIASPEVRGTLGTGFQLLVTIGVLFAYLVGEFVCWRWLALACLVPALLFATAMLFAKESPTYLVTSGKHVQAREALTHFRGEKYNIEPELVALQDSISTEKVSMGELLKPHNMRPLVISLCLMLFQQCSGINAILFNLNEIFAESSSSDGSSMDSATSSVVIAAVQVGMTGVASVLMDRAGRKVLLLASSSAMALSLAAMGTYFTIKNAGGDVSSITWLPLVSLIVFIAFFSVGFGPIPWLMMGEIFSADVKELASTVAAMSNWLLSFVVTLVYKPLVSAIGDAGVYWMYTGFCGASFLFCLLVVKETKGKTSREIAAMFGAK